MLMRKLFIVCCCIFSLNLFAQDNYEIQVYGAQTQAKNSSIFELHSNYTFSGEKDIVKGVRPSYRSLHETIEITTGKKIKTKFKIIGDAGCDLHGFM